MPHTTKITARIWVRYDDDYVRLALRDGDEITICDGGPTDEGSSYRWETYSRDGEIIRLRWETSSRDCDGSFADGGECETTIHMLEAVTMPDHIVECGGPRFRPQWERVGHGWQRDYEAERAGY